MAVLRVAFENFLIAIGGHIEATEITGDNSTLSVLRAKGQRMGYKPEGHGAFAQIQKISGVPNIGEAFAHKRLTASQLLDLRCTPHAQSLRDWFAQGAPSQTEEDIVARYVESIGKPSIVEKLPIKLLRFATTIGIGFVEPVTGGVATAVDTFLLNKWFPSKSPRLFLEQAKVVLANTPVVREPKMKGRDRNALCSCGSGKKYKKCCGRF
jgi:hypothetical protein